MSNTDTLDSNSSKEFSDLLNPCKIFLAADGETHCATVEELLTLTYMSWTYFQQRVCRGKICLTRLWSLHAAEELWGPQHSAE